MPYSVTLIEGVQHSLRRGIAFLESDTDQDVNAKQVFDGLKPKAKSDVRSKMDYWLSGETCKKYFHGWDDENKGCFVFKWKEGRYHRRLYGFLCHPRADEKKGFVRDPAFLACVLVSHALKDGSSPKSVTAPEALWM